MSASSDGRVAFCFGVSRRPELPGPVLVRLLTELGSEPAAARSRLARLVSRGMLTTHRRGRITDYRLAGAFEQAYARADLDRVEEPATWDGEFHGLLVTVPERDRPYRDAFRRQAGLAGYGPLRPGLYIAPTDRSAALADTVAHAPAGASVRPVALRLAADDARAAAAQAWDLPALERRYRAAAAAVRRALDAHVDPVPSRGLLVDHAVVTEEGFGVLAGDPALPAALLPPDWPRAELLALLAEATRRLGPPVAGYVDALVAGQA